MDNSKVGKIFVVLGKSSSGKSSAAKEIANDLNITQIISYTSRKPRLGEQDGIDYNFVSEEVFENESFVCKEQYIVHPDGYQYYGVKLLDLMDGKDHIIVLTPSGYRELKKIFGDKVYGVYIMAPEDDRLKRYIERDPSNPNSKQEACRRVVADDRDFHEFEFEVEDIIINNKTRDDLINSLAAAIFMERTF